MKIKTSFLVEENIYNILFEQAMFEYENYECDWGSRMEWDEEYPNHFTQFTSGGYRWDVTFLSDNTIEVEFNGVRNSAMSSNLVGWHFAYYRPGDIKPVKFVWNFWNGETSCHYELYGECLEYETSTLWNGKPIGFEATGDVWGRNADVLVLQRNFTVDNETRKSRPMTDEEVIIEAGYGEEKAVYSDDLRIYIPTETIRSHSHIKRRDSRNK